MNFVVGSKGNADMRMGEIVGQNSWKFTGDNPRTKVYERWELIESIRKGQPMNQAEFGAYSTLAAIIGRESVYTGKTLTWEEMLYSDLDLFPKKVEFGPAPKRPVPIPGQPRPR